MRSLTALAMAVLLATALGCGNDPESPSEPVSPLASVTATAASPLAFRQVSGGRSHTCGVTTDNKAYCWGEATFGELGNGNPEGPQECGSEGNDGCSSRPVAVLGGLRFQNVSAGEGFTCGVATDSRAWCWGWNVYGEVGDGSTTKRLTPVAVHGGHLFRQVSAGSGHACGLTTENRIYCWGANSDGELGDGTQTNRLAPRLVAGGRAWRLVSAGGGYTCALTTDNQAFCWGLNNWGQLGDSTTAARRLVPVRVAGGRTFAQLSSGYDHTCAVTGGGRGFCWGANYSGQLGNGGTTQARWPKAVAGGLAMKRITAGAYHTCAETSGNKAYCWGDNYFGQLGIGTLGGADDCSSRPCSTRPLAVAGGLSFVQVDAGDYHTCALTAANLAYCWGDDFYGQTGDGHLYFHELAPTPVVGPL